MTQPTHGVTRPTGVISEVHGPVVVIECECLPPLRRALAAVLDGET